MSFIRLSLRGAALRHHSATSFSMLHQSRILQRAAFSTASSLDKAQIESRVLDVLKTFEKVSAEKVSPDLDPSTLLFIVCS
jgi:hypothetical protein